MTHQIWFGRQLRTGFQLSGHDLPTKLVCQPLVSRCFGLCAHIVTVRAHRANGWSLVTKTQSFCRKPLKVNSQRFSVEVVPRRQSRGRDLADRLVDTTQPTERDVSHTADSVEMFDATRGDDTGPLADVRIIAVEQYGAGPWATLQLADLGAEVIKIEDPRVGGDVGRYVPPFNNSEDSLFFESLNRNKKSFSLDVSTPRGRQVFEDLVEHSDVVFCNVRGDVPEKLRLRYDDLKHLNPAIVCCALTGFGTTGPRRAEPGYDYIMQGLTGWMSITGEPGGPPTKSGLSLVDFSTGLAAAGSILAGLHAARRDGVGLDCDVSLFETAVSMTNYLAAWHLTAGYEAKRTRHSAHPSLVPGQVFEASDGWIIVQAGKDVFWRRLVDVLGRPEWALDDRFAGFEGRFEHRDDLVSNLEQVFRQRACAEWLEDLREARIPSGPVLDLADALDDPQVAARELIIETDHPFFGTVRQVRSSLRAGSPRSNNRRAPRRNEDEDYVLADILGSGHFDSATLIETSTLPEPGERTMPAQEALP